MNDTGLSLFRCVAGNNIVLSLPHILPLIYCFHFLREALYSPAGALLFSHI